MSEPVIIAIIGATGAVIAAIVGACLTSRRPHQGHDPVPSSRMADTKPSATDSSLTPPVSPKTGTNAPPNTNAQKLPELEVLSPLGGVVEEPSTDGPITTDRGSYVLWLGPPLVSSPRFVHFSWGGRAGPQSFKVRDYIGRKLQQHRGATPQPEDQFQIGVCSLSRDEVWAAACVHIPARGDLFHNVQDFPWWENTLTAMTRKREKGNRVEQSATADGLRE